MKSLTGVVGIARNGNKWHVEAKSVLTIASEGGTEPEDLQIAGAGQPNL